MTYPGWKMSCFEQLTLFLESWKTQQASFLDQWRYLQLTEPRSRNAMLRHVLIDRPQIISFFVSETSVSATTRFSTRSTPTTSVRASTRRRSSDARSGTEASDSRCRRRRRSCRPTATWTSGARLAEVTSSRPWQVGLHCLSIVEKVLEQAS